MSGDTFSGLLLGNLSNTSDAACAGIEDDEAATGVGRLPCPPSYAFLPLRFAATVQLAAEQLSEDGYVATSWVVANM
jgi:hypothetical protein